MTLVLSGYFRLSPHKIKRDGRHPGPWKARRPDVQAGQAPAPFPSLSLESGGPGGHRPGAVDRVGGPVKSRSAWLGLEGRPFLPCSARPGPQVTEATRSCLHTSLPASVPRGPPSPSQPLCPRAVAFQVAILRCPCRHLCAVSSVSSPCSVPT